MMPNLISGGVVLDVELALVLVVVLLLLLLLLGCTPRWRASAATRPSELAIAAVFCASKACSVLDPICIAPWLEIYQCDLPL
jgi:hypothetical protein